MPKAYWVTCYRSISDPQKVAAYAKLAPVATALFGCRYVARGTAAAAFEVGAEGAHRNLGIPKSRKGGRGLSQPRLSGSATRARRRRGA